MKCIFSRISYTEDEANEFAVVWERTLGSTPYRLVLRRNKVSGIVDTFWIEYLKCRSAMLEMIWDVITINSSSIWQQVISAIISDLGTPLFPNKPVTDSKRVELTSEPIPGQLGPNASHSTPEGGSAS